MLLGGIALVGNPFTVSLSCTIRYIVHDHMKCCKRVLSFRCKKFLQKKPCVCNSTLNVVGLQKNICTCT
jgi:hypothetical protein